MSRTTDSPGVKRASELVAAVVETQGDPGPLTRRILTAALDVEEMACAMWVFDHSYYTSEHWDTVPSEAAKETYRALARAVLASILGDES